MDRYAVIGSPIGHSLSPRIHALFAEQCDQALEYTAVEVKPDEFFHSVNRLVDEGFNGLNVTVPLKEPAWEMADECNRHANRAKAVNTLIFESDGRRLGANTDGPGLVRDLTVNHGQELADRAVLMLGAGGAARGVLMPLLNSRPRSLVLANRTVGKAETLAGEFEDIGRVETCGFESLDRYADEPFDLIINATSAGLSGELPPLPDNILRPGGITYDMMYAAEPTAFVEWGRRHGAGSALDGLGMLVEQAAESFSLWRGVRPDTAPVITALNRELGRR